MKRTRTPHLEVDIESVSMEQIFYMRPATTKKAHQPTSSRGQTPRLAATMSTAHH